MTALKAVKHDDGWYWQVEFEEGAAMTGTFCQGADWRPYRGTCGACGAPLIGRNGWFCAAKRKTGCRDRYMANHDWGMARRAALKRDGCRCVRCGSELDLEVHHIVPRNGNGYRRGCWNHLENLETLCHVCHVATRCGDWKEAQP